MGSRNIKSEADHVKVLKKAQKEVRAVEKRFKDVRSSAAALQKAVKESPPDSVPRDEREAYQRVLDSIEAHLGRGFRNEMAEFEFMLEDWDRALKNSGRL